MSPTKGIILINTKIGDIILKEVWKDAKGFEGFYKVSNIGRIKSLDRTTIDTIGRSRFYEGRIMRFTTSGSGYYQCGLTVQGIRYFPYVHKLVAESFVDNLRDLIEVNHIDHNKNNNNATNLEWCTRQENVIKMVEFYGIQHISNHCECGKVIDRKSKRCVKCHCLTTRIKNRPSKEELHALIKTEPFVKIGKCYGVSDNAIRAWCKEYGLPYRKKDLINIVLIEQAEIPFEDSAIFVYKKVIEKKGEDKNGRGKIN